MPLPTSDFTRLEQARGYLPAQCVECGVSLARCQQMLSAGKCPWKRNLLLTGQYTAMNNRTYVIPYAYESLQAASASPGR